MKALCQQNLYLWHVLGNILICYNKEVLMLVCHTFLVSLLVFLRHCVMVLAKVPCGWTHKCMYAKRKRVVLTDRGWVWQCLLSSWVHIETRWIIILSMAHPPQWIVMKLMRKLDAIIGVCIKPICEWFLLFLFQTVPIYSQLLNYATCAITKNTCFRLQLLTAGSNRLSLKNAKFSAFKILTLKLAHLIR